MEAAQSYPTLSPSRDTEVLVSYLPVPGLGVLPVNAFVLRAKEPVLVDTGLAALRDGFMSSLRRVIDPVELRWIWLTHTDPDHIGNLRAVLDEAPRARVVTTFLGMGKMNLLGAPVERTYLLNPGQSLDVGDRELHAIRPPTFDAPETTGLYDGATGALFSADAFGAVLQEPAERAEAIPSAELREGARLWATVDAPWLSMIPEAKFRPALEAVRALRPKFVLSAHLPPSEALTELLCGELDRAREAPPFEGPDQAALERALAGV